MGTSQDSKIFPEPISRSGFFASLGAASAVFRLVWQDFGRARRPLFIYEFLFKLVEFWLLVPLVTVVLAAILAQAGHVAVTNQDILSFLLTPVGLLYAALFSTTTVALLLFEQAGIMIL